MVTSSKLCSATEGSSTDGNDDTAVLTLLASRALDNDIRSANDAKTVYTTNEKRWSSNFLL